MTATYGDRLRGVASSLAIKTPVRVATTANITLSGLQTIDGVTVAADDRVLVKNQTDGAENGIWVASAGAWSRATDWNGARDVVRGTQVLAVEGAIGSDFAWQVATPAPIVGTSDVTFTAAPATISRIGIINLSDILSDNGLNPNDLIALTNGENTDDQSAGLGDFQAALAIESAAGRVPHGKIQNCTIYTSASPNFAMDRLRLDTEGVPHVICTTANPGIKFDGRGLGVNGYGVRRMNIGTLKASTATGTQGWMIYQVQESTLWSPQCGGAVTAAFDMQSCVSTQIYEMHCSDQIEPWITQPSIGLRLQDNLAPLSGANSWCAFYSPRLDYVKDYGLWVDISYGALIIGGNIQGTGRNRAGVVGGALGIGAYYTANAEFNKMIGTDLEFNAGSDAEIRGKRNDFLMVDSQSENATTSVKFIGASAYGNTWRGGKAGRIDLDANTKSNVIDGMQIGAGGIVDLATGANHNTKTNITNTAGNWVEFEVTGTPVVAAQAGAITAYTSFSTTRRTGMSARVTINVTVDNNGTGASGINVTLPFAPKYNGVMAGKQSNAGNLSVEGRLTAGSTTMLVTTSAGAYPAATGTSFYLSGEYQI